MSDLKTRLAQDLKTAMKEKDKIRKDVIQLIRAEIQQIEKDEQTTLSEQDAQKVVQRELKKRQDTIAELRGQRPEVLPQLEEEMAIIQTYLPEPLTDEALDQLIAEAIAEVGATSMKDMGQVMKVLMPKVGTQADGKTVNLRLRAKLG